MQRFMRAQFVPKLATSLYAGYSFSDLRCDAMAGLTVAIVALPLAMALGIASGASPDKGLATAVIAGFLISALGGSRVQIGGPTGAFVVVIAAVIAQHGYSGLLLATFMAGVILIVAGYAGLGKMMRFIPMPVVTGFTAGIAVIIATSQIGDFFGLKADHAPAEFLGKWEAYVQAFDTINVHTLGVGLGSLALIIGLKRLAPRLPGYLIAIILASTIVAVFHAPVDTVGTRFPNMPTDIFAVRMPAFSLKLVKEVIPAAFTIAFLAGIEALLSAVVADGMTGYRHRSGQELVGQGVANIASALCGGLPATGAIARTATNVRAGAKTPMAGVFHALFLLAILIAAGDLVAYIPMATLAAILLVVAWGMSEADRFSTLMRMDRTERTLLLLTFALTVFVDLPVAIGVGVTLASLSFTSRMAKMTGLLRQDEDGEEPEQRQGLPAGVEVFRISGPLFFGAAGEMLDTLTRIGQSPKAIILRFDRVPYIDSDGLHVLAEFVRQAHLNRADVLFCDMNGEVMKTLQASAPEFVGARAAAHLPEALSQIASRQS